jgi:hypothetical protein
LYFDEGSSAPNYSYSLVEHLNPEGIGNLDGTNPQNNPLFIEAVDLNTVPTVAGTLHLQENSPVIDQGNNLADLDGDGPGTDTIASIRTDLVGDVRIGGGTIDIGAFEYPQPLSSFQQWAFGKGLTIGFNDLPEMNPERDSLTNLYEFAFGLDPLSSDSGVIILSGDDLVQRGSPKLSEIGDVYEVVYVRRTAEFGGDLLSHQVQTSTNLNDWVVVDSDPEVLGLYDDVELVRVLFSPSSEGDETARFFRLLVHFAD